MEATLSRTQPPSRPAQAGLIASLIVVAAVAWAVTGDRMRGMDAGPGTELGDLAWFAFVWVTMMAAMMLPSIVPMVLAYARFQLAATPAALIAIEKLVPWQTVATRGVAVLLAALGLALAFAPEDMPGLTVPGSSDAAPAMQEMRMEE